MAQQKSRPTVQEQSGKNQLNDRSLVAQDGQGKLSVYRRLVRDRGISHGAFRLWHYLRDRADAKGYCYPEQRTIVKEMPSNVHSLKPWTTELMDGGYLRLAGRKAHGGFVYQVLTGGGEPMTKRSRSDAKNSNAGPVSSDAKNSNSEKVALDSVAENSNHSVAEDSICSDAENRNGSNNKGVRTGSNNDFPQPSASVISIPKDFEIINYFTAIRDPNPHEAMLALVARMKKRKWRVDWKAEARKLRAERV